YYICQPDSTGNALLEALVERARAGVRVRLLLDAVGSAKATKRFFAPLLEAGGEFAWFHPARFGRVWTRTWVNMRTHRKIVVIDGRIGFTGGINITDDENDRLRDDAYRDLHLRIEGDAVRRLQLVFVEDWMYATRSRALVAEIARNPPGRRPGPVATQVLPSGPDSAWESIHPGHVAATPTPRRPGRTPDGAAAQRQPAGDPGRALLLRRPAGRGREGLRVRATHAAHQGAAGRRRVLADRLGELRPPQFPAQLRTVGAVPRRGDRRGTAGTVRRRPAC